MFIDFFIGDKGCLMRNGFIFFEPLYGTLWFVLLPSWHLRIYGNTSVRCLLNRQCAHRRYQLDNAGHIRSKIAAQQSLIFLLLHASLIVLPFYAPILNAGDNLRLSACSLERHLSTVPSAVK